MSKIEKILPPSLMKIIAASRWRHWKNKTNEEIFSEIYSEKCWGESQTDVSPFYSGGGSHGEDIVKEYVEVVKGLIHSQKNIKTLVDLGCGDFNIGSKLVENVEKYVGVDVVPDLIEFNQSKFSTKDVTFKLLDITTDNLPKGDLVVVRQVLQHLTNQQIKDVLVKIRMVYKHFILTEHNPKRKNFHPNVDIPTGPSIRANINSGLVIEKPPFSFECLERKVLSEVPHSGGVISTVYYRLK